VPVAPGAQHWISPSRRVEGPNLYHRMAVAQFTREYTTVRRAEGWGSSDSAYYRALPFRDLTGRFPGIWRIRGRSYLTFVNQVLEPLELDALEPPSPAFGGLSQRKRRMTILDLGAGCGWLSNRLALRGHSVIAIDLLLDPFDGLGARRHYEVEIAALVAEFDQLPLHDSQADLVVFNASLHYSTDFAKTLSEALRVLREGGTLVILDSPMYVDPTSGQRMVQERQARFLATYGFASDALPSEHFVTPARLAELATELGLAWQIHTPALDWRTSVGRTIGGLRARREPARFPVIVGKRR
jgi:SAM-dependent methyltransferase